MKEKITISSQILRYKINNNSSIKMNLMIKIKIKITYSIFQMKKEKNKALICKILI